LCRAKASPIRSRSARWPPHKCAPCPTSRLSRATVNRILRKSDRSRFRASSLSLRSRSMPRREIPAARRTQRAPPPSLPPPPRCAPLWTRKSANRPFNRVYIINSRRSRSAVRLSLFPPPSLCLTPPPSLSLSLSLSLHLFPLLSALCSLSIQITARLGWSCRDLPLQETGRTTIQFSPRSALDGIMIENCSKASCAMDNLSFTFDT